MTMLAPAATRTGRRSTDSSTGMRNSPPPTPINPAAAPITTPSGRPRAASRTGRGWYSVCAISPVPGSVFHDEAVVADAQATEHLVRQRLRDEPHGAVGQGEVGPAGVVAAEGADSFLVIGEITVVV